MSGRGSALPVVRVFVFALCATGLILGWVFEGADVLWMTALDGIADVVEDALR